MNIECPKCGSTEFTKVSMVYAEGISDLEARSRGWGLLFGSGGADIAFGRFRTTAEIQTQLSQRVSPPHKWSYWKILFGGLLGLLILEFILGYVDTFLRTGGNFKAQLAWFGYGYLSVVAFVLIVAFRYNFAVFPRRYRLWERSFMCRRCGQLLEQPQSEDHRSDALIPKVSL
jgi:DNA-directed RNA polymerase subunit RPC12/RpoP